MQQRRAKNESLEKGTYRGSSLALARLPTLSPVVSTTKQMGQNFSRPPGDRNLFWLVPPPVQARRRTHHRKANDRPTSTSLASKQVKNTSRRAKRQCCNRCSACHSQSSTCPGKGTFHRVCTAPRYVSKLSSIYEPYQPQYLANYRNWQI